MEENFKIEELSKNEVSELIDFLYLAHEFKKPFDIVAEKTTWAFKRSDSPVVLVMKDGDKIIGARGGIQWPISSGDTPLRTFQFHGTIVHPEYRRRGVFSELNRMFLKEAIKRNYDLIYNVSVKSSRLGYEKLGWSYLNGFRRLTFFNNPLAFIKTTKKEEVQPHNVFSGELNEVFLEQREVQFKNFVHTDYSQSFLKWRLNNSNEDYRLYQDETSAVIYKIVNNNNRRELIIGDFFLMENKFSFFRKALKGLTRNENPDITYTYIFNTHPYYLYYYRSLFAPNPMNYNLNFGIKYLNSNAEKLIEGKKIAFSFLDIDTF